VIVCVECLPALSRNAFILLWSQYVTSFTTKGLPENLLRVVHNRLVMLPWLKLFPDLQAVELMVKASHSFLLVVLCNPFIFANNRFANGDSFSV